MLAPFGAIDAAELLAREEVARILAAQILDQEREPWALVVNALSQVLAREKRPDAGDAGAGDPAKPAPFKLIQGGAA